MNDPQSHLDQIQCQASRHETPCGQGRMVWHLWDRSGGTAPVVVLFHGGAGSWRHWIRTIPALVPFYREYAERYTVYWNLLNDAH